MIRCFSSFYTKTMLAAFLFIILSIIHREASGEVNVVVAQIRKNAQLQSSLLETKNYENVTTVQAQNSTLKKKNSSHTGSSSSQGFPKTKLASSTRSTLQSQGKMTSATHAVLRRLDEGGYPWDEMEAFFSLLGKWFCELISYFAGGAFTNVPDVSEDSLSYFTVEYDVDMNVFDPLLEVDELRGPYELTMQSMLNVETVGSGTQFLKFDVEKRSEKKNRRRASANGVCTTKKCNVPSSYGFPKIITPEETALFESFKSVPYVQPGQVYVMEKTRDLNGVITYTAGFQPNILYPFSTFPGFTMEQVPGSLELVPYVSCKVTQDECNSQREAITSVFDDLGLEYNENETECLWNGVICDELFLVKHFFVDDRSYSLPMSNKPFPTGIYDLVHMQKLHLKNIGLVGTIDSNIGVLTQVKEIHFELNELTGTIPSEIGLLSNLKKLSLAGNNLVGGFPPEIGDLEKLKILDISGNPNFGQQVGRTWKAIVPSEIGNLRNLEQLKLYDSNINAALPDTFQSLTELVEIDVGNSNIMGNTNMFITMTKLRVLQADNNAFTGSISKDFEALSELRKMSLYGNDLTGPFPTFISSLSQMSDFVIGDTAIYGSIPTEIGTLENLTNFDTAYCDITGELPSEIGNLKNLEVFQLVGNAINGTLATELGGLTSLGALVLAGNTFSGPIPTEFGMLNNVEAIDIAGNELTGPIPTELYTLTKLEDIALGGNKLTGNVGFLCDLEYTDIKLEDFPMTDCSITQTSAVEQLYAGLNLQNYDSGLFRKSVCEFTGVGCNSDGKVTDINLVGLGLDGTISDVIGQIHFLTNLDLSNNNVVGTVPEELGNLLFLKSIDISDNDLTGDAAFLCKGGLELTLDEGEVYACTNSPSTSLAPSHGPSESPTTSLLPSLIPSSTPSLSLVPSDVPSKTPTSSTLPSSIPSSDPSNVPSSAPSSLPSSNPSPVPPVPSNIPSSVPSHSPSETPTSSLLPSSNPSPVPPVPSSSPSVTVVFEQLGDNLNGNVDYALAGDKSAITPDGLTVCAAGTKSLLLFNYDGTAWNMVDLNDKVTSKVTEVNFDSNDGTKLVVGQAKLSSNKGQVIVLELSGGTWVQRGQTLTGQQAGDWFGISADINGDGTVILVGSKFTSPRKVTLYDYNSSTLQWEFRYDVTNSATGFAHSAQLSSDAQIMAVGCNKCSPNGANSGNVYVYSVGAGAATEILSAPGTAQNDFFGFSLALSADGMVLASTGDANYVKVFHADDNNRSSYTETLEISGEASRVALSADGSRIAVGSFTFDSGSEAGKVEIFALRGANAISLHYVECTSDGKQCGKSIAISADGRVYLNPIPYLAQPQRGRTRVYRQV